MDNKIRTTLVAAAVSAALTSTAFAATDLKNTSKTLPRFDHNVAMSSQAKAPAKGLRNTKALSKQMVKSPGQSQIVRSKSGHFDDTLGVSTFSWAQNNDRSPISALPYNTLNRKVAIAESARHFASINAVKHGVTAKALEQAELKSIHDLGRGAVIAKYQQRINGIEVLDHQLNVVLNQDMQLVATSGYFSKAKSSKRPVASQFSVSATNAISKAFTDMGVIR